MTYQIITQPLDVIGKFVADRSKTPEPWGNYTAIGLARDNFLIAGFVYNNFIAKPTGGFQSCCMHVGAIEGKRWLTRDFLFAAFDYPFNQLGCQRVSGLIARKNKVARKFAEGLGGVVEATLHKQIPGDDIVVYRLFKDECRWLNIKRVKETA